MNKPDTISQLKASFKAKQRQIEIDAAKKLVEISGIREAAMSNYLTAMILNKMELHIKRLSEEA